MYGFIPSCSRNSLPWAFLIQIKTFKHHITKGAKKEGDIYKSPRATMSVIHELNMPESELSTIVSKAT